MANTKTPLTKDLTRLVVNFLIQSGISPVIAKMVVGTYDVESYFGGLIIDELERAKAIALKIEDALND